ncbi:MAG: arginine--tRNA ligase [Alphaproteobacteria bacterium]|nr:arginine--tRNA ligase [Alphaproteobacteria bacterium]
MNVFKYFRAEIIRELDDLVATGRLPAGLDFARVAAEPPREAGHGDISTNAAMVLAKPAQLKPRDLAALLVEHLRAHSAVVSADIAGPGFINLRLADSFWRQQLADALVAGQAYGDSDMGRGERVNVEYVSANPTGPMHVGHARGAVFGDVLAALLTKAGYDVTREYYINDAGAQVDVLARSAHLRYREALGEKIGSIPDGYYPGDYLCDVGVALADRDGKRWLVGEENAWLAPVRDFSVEAMMDLIRRDLDALGIEHAVFSSERALVEARRVEDVLAFLESRGLVYVGTLDPPKGKTPEDWEPRPQTLFRATQFGDDVDRPLKKSDGSWTYFAADIAYHFDKFQRGFLNMIDVLGADHFGYIKRMQAAVKAISDGKAALDVKICQLVNLLDQGEPVKMSKRAGTFVTLRDVVDRVGKDVVRFIMLTRRNDQPLDFDFAKVQEKTRDNPVFYVQYAHARAHSVLRNARETLPGLDLSPAALAQGALDRLTDLAELALIKSMAAWPRVVESAAESHEPHRLAFYLYDLAAEFHALWNRGNEDATLRFLIPGDANLSAARLALVSGVASVIASGLNVFGVEPVEEMR